MQKILLLISLLLASFFPYMPLVHSEDFSPGSHCEEHEQEAGEKEDHDMSICQSLTSEIGITHASIGTISEGIPFLSYYTRYLALPQKKIHTKNPIIHYSPPWGPSSTPPDFVGTIKIIS